MECNLFLKKVVLLPVTCYNYLRQKLGGFINDRNEHKI